MHEEFAKFMTQEQNHHPFSLQMMGISYCDGTYQIRRSKSDITCIEYIMEGKGTIQTKGRVFYPQKGDVYILHQNDDHYYYSDKKDPWVKIWMNVKGPLAENIMQLYQLSEVNHIENMDVYSYFQEMWQQANGKYNDVSTEELLDRIAAILFQMIQKISKKSMMANEQKYPEALALKNFLDRNIERNITSQIMAEQAGLSTSQTIRVFKKAYEVTPYDYLLLRRIDIAKLLLENSYLRVNEIAKKTGFQDEGYFSRLFKEKVGSTPSEFRKDNSALV